MPGSSRNKRAFWAQQVLVQLQALVLEITAGRARPVLKQKRSQCHGIQIATQECMENPKWRTPHSHHIAQNWRAGLFLSPPLHQRIGHHNSDLRIGHQDLATPERHLICLTTMDCQRHYAHKATPVEARFHRPVPEQDQSSPQSPKKRPRAPIKEQAVKSAQHLSTSPSTFNVQKAASSHR